MLYIAVDPGGDKHGTTGIVTAEVTANTLRLIGHDNLRKWSVEDYIKQLPELTKDKVVHCVIEDYVIRQGTPGQTSTPATIKGMFIGAIILLGVGNKRFTYNLQQPVERIWVTDAMLKVVGLDDVRGGNHHDSKEAARHLLAYLVGIKNPYVLKKLREEIE